MRWLIGCLAVTIVVLVPSLSMATILDPATLHIGPGAGTACATGCGGDPNLISSTRLDIYQNAGGAGGLDNPILLILGIPNYSGAFAPAITDVFINPYPGGTSTNGTVAFATAGTYGLTAPVSGDYFGQFNGSYQDVYSFLTLWGPHDYSNNFGNWAGNEVAGVNASYFGIYVFALSSSVALGANGLIDITFGTALPKGTYAVAYGADLDKRGNGYIYDTPFTEAGLVRNGGGGGGGQAGVPEPASLALVGSGLLLAVAKYRRKHKTQKK